MSKKQSTSDVKDRIILVARELFIQNGYAGTSVRDIAAASDANIAHISYYFSSKENLFEIIFEEAFDIFAQKIFGIICSNTSFDDLVRSWINAYYELLTEYPQIPVFILHEVNQNPKRLTDRFKSKKPFEIFFHLSERIRIEVELGNIRETPAENFVLNVLSLCAFPFMSRGLALNITEKPLAEYNQMLQKHKGYVIDFVLNALRP